MSMWVQVEDPNPAAGVDRELLPDGTVWERVADDALLGGQVVDSAFIRDRKPDLLGTVSKEVDRLGELADLRVRVVLQWDGELGRLLALLDSFKGELATRGQWHGISFDGCTGDPARAAARPASGSPRRDEGEAE